MALIKTSKKWVYATVTAVVAAVVAVLGVYNMQSAGETVNESASSLIEYVPADTSTTTAVQ